MSAGEIISILDKRVEEAGNRKRQTVLLSATLHSRLSTLASLSLKEFDPIGFKVKVHQPQLLFSVSERYLLQQITPEKSFT